MEAVDRVRFAVERCNISRYNLVIRSRQNWGPFLVILVQTITPVPIPEDRISRSDSPKRKFESNTFGN